LLGALERGGIELRGMRLVSLAEVRIRRSYRGEDAKSASNAGLSRSGATMETKGKRNRQRSGHCPRSWMSRQWQTSKSWPACWPSARSGSRRRIKRISGKPLGLRPFRLLRPLRARVRIIFCSTSMTAAIYATPKTANPTFELTQHLTRPSERRAGVVRHCLE
jgi:hypothetical protein